MKLDGSSQDIKIGRLTGVTFNGGSTFVASNSAPYQRGDVSLLQGSTTATVATSLPRVGRIGFHDAENIILTVHPDVRRISVIHIADGSVKTFGPVNIAGEIIETQGLSDGRVALLTSKTLATLDSLDELGSEPFIEPPLPIFVGSWARLFYHADGNSLNLSDVRFEIPDGPTAGFVSNSREDGQGDPVPLLVVGGATGSHNIDLVKALDGTKLGSG